MKLIIQIPCLNEAGTIGLTLQQLPRKMPGFDQVEWLIIDDGSQDDTVAEARAHGADHVVSLTSNQGLAKAFMAGIKECLARGADVIVNTDADNQYCADDIGKIVAPVRDREADIVIGARPIKNIEHFSGMKKLLQRLGSWIVRVVSKTDIPDAPSGFRAISRSAAMRINVFSRYTYTLEMIIQAGRNNMSILSVPIRVNEDLRPSRLVSSIPAYIKRSIFTIVRIFVLYEPFRFFFSIGMLLLSFGFILGLRFVYFLLTSAGDGHIQSLILAAVLLVSGFLAVLVAFIADLLAANRMLLEQIRYEQLQDQSGDSSSSD